MKFNTQMERAVPNLPGTVDWPLAKTICEHLRTKNYAPVDPDGEFAPEVKGQRYRQATQVHQKLTMLWSTQCKICDGYGHNKKTCPVDLTIRRALAFSRIATSKYSSAKNRMVLE